MNIENIVAITLRYLQTDQILSLNNPWAVDMILKPQV